MARAVAAAENGASERTSRRRGALISIHGALADRPEIESTLVHPQHGAVMVTGYETRARRGEEREYIVLMSQDPDLLIRVPLDQLAEVGVRAVLNQHGVDSVFATLGEETIEEPLNWSRRFKQNEQKIASGEVLLVAEVVRDIARRDVDGGVSPGEKKLLERARRNLLGELELVPSIGSMDAAIALVDRAIGIDADAA